VPIWKERRPDHIDPQVPEQRFRARRWPLAPACGPATASL
jgi:hypothetical protein